MSTVDIKALAKLARMEVSDEEVAKLEKSLPSILAFVETIQRADTSNVSAAHALRNVMRDDTDAHEGGIYSERLLSAAPARDGNRVAVKQVISRKPAKGGPSSGGK